MTTLNYKTMDYIIRANSAIATTFVEPIDRSRGGDSDRFLHELLRVPRYIREPPSNNTIKGSEEVRVCHSPQTIVIATGKCSRRYYLQR